MNHGIQKIARLRTLYEVARIKKIMSWNDYPCYVRNNFKCLEKKKKKNDKNTDTLEQDNIATNFCRIPYAGIQREKLFKNVVKKLKRHVDEPFKLENICRV